ncbi:MAG: HEAT repeat domain-containing protein [Planctomycetes bacterium]|nr:HEAT repeat domain-containing protein [Planctomycetota bacterium]
MLRSVLTFALVLLLGALVALHPAAAEPAPAPAAPPAPPPDATAEEVKTALDAFKKASVDRDEAKRIAALDGLAGVRHPQIYQTLARFLTTDTETVRIAAARALGGFEDGRCLPHLEAALGAGKVPDKVLTALYDAIGNCHDARAVPGLGKFLRSRGLKYDVKKTKEEDATLPVAAAIAALGKIKVRESVENLLKYGEDLTAPGQNVSGPPNDVRSDYVRKTQEAVAAALGMKTRDFPGTEIEDYVKWWRENKNKAFAPAHN